MADQGDAGPSSSAAPNVSSPTAAAATALPRVRKSGSELPTECRALLDRLKRAATAGRLQLYEELKHITSWTYGKCELSHWLGLLSQFDAILEEAGQTVYPFTMRCDLYGESFERRLLLWILNFTTLLIEHSFSSHTYRSMGHLMNLLESSDMSIVLGVLNLLYMFSKRSNFIARMDHFQRVALAARLHYLAESWGGTAAGFGLADCCDHRKAPPASCSSLLFEFYSCDPPATDDRPVLQRITMDNVASTSRPLGETLAALVHEHKIPKHKHSQLLVALRLAYHFPDYHSRLQCVLARLQALTVLAFSNTVSSTNSIPWMNGSISLRPGAPTTGPTATVCTSTNMLMYPGLLEELVAVVELNMAHLAEVRAAALRTLTSLIHFDRSTHYQQRRSGHIVRLSQIIDGTGADQCTGFLPVLVRSCVAYLTHTQHADFTQSGLDPRKTNANMLMFEGEVVDQFTPLAKYANPLADAMDLEVQCLPLLPATALFSLLFHLASYETGADALLLSGMMESLVQVLGWHGTEVDHITFVTRAVRVIHLMTNHDTQAFNANKGIKQFVSRLEYEVNLSQPKHSYVVVFAGSRSDQPGEEGRAGVTRLGTGARVVNPTVRIDGTVGGANYGVSHREDTASANSASGGPTNSAAGDEVRGQVPGPDLEFMYNVDIYYNDQNEGVSCLPQQAVLLKSMLNFIKKAIQEPTLHPQVINQLIESTFPESLMLIIANAEYYGPSLFLLAIDVITVAVYQEPTVLRDIQDRGLAAVVYHALLYKEVPPTREMIESLPNVFSALCMNSRGLNAFTYCSPFVRMFRVLVHPLYDPAGDAAVSLGNATDELVRNHPTLRANAMVAVKNLLDHLVHLGMSRDYVTDVGWRTKDARSNAPTASECSTPSATVSAPGCAGGSTARRSPAVDGAENAEQAVGASVSSNTTDVTNDRVDPVPINSDVCLCDDAARDVPSPLPTQELTEMMTMFYERCFPTNGGQASGRSLVPGGRTADGRLIVPLTEYITNVTKFVDAMLSNHATNDHAREFIRQKCVKPLLQLLALDNLPSDLYFTPTPQSVASVCRTLVTLTQDSSVLETCLLQLKNTLQGLKSMYSNRIFSRSSLLLDELISAGNDLSNAFSSPRATPLLHAVMASYGYVLVFAHVCRTGQSNIRNLSLRHWGAVGLEVLRDLRELYTAIVWESALLLTLSTDSAVPDDCQLTLVDLARLNRNVHKGDVTVPSSAVPATTGTGTSQAASSTPVPMDIDDNENGAVAAGDCHTARSWSFYRKTYLKPLLGASSRLSFVIGDLFRTLVKLAVGSQRRRPMPFSQQNQLSNQLHYFQQLRYGQEIAGILNKLLAESIDSDCPRLPTKTAVKTKITLLICSVGSLSSMLFDEKDMPYHLMLHNFCLHGGQRVFFRSFKWVLAVALEHRVRGDAELPVPASEFFDVWLRLLEKMVHPKNVVDSPHTAVPYSAGTESPLLALFSGFRYTFEPLRYLIQMQRLGLEAIHTLLEIRPTPVFGKRAIDSMLTIQRHIVLSQKAIEARLRRETEELQSLEAVFLTPDDGETLRAYTGDSVRTDAGGATCTASTTTSASTTSTRQGSVGSRDITSSARASATNARVDTVNVHVPDASSSRGGATTHRASSSASRTASAATSPNAPELSSATPVMATSPSMVANARQPSSAAASSAGPSTSDEQPIVSGNEPATSETYGVQSPPRALSSSGRTCMHFNGPVFTTPPPIPERLNHRSIIGHFFASLKQLTERGFSRFAVTNALLLTPTVEEATYLLLRNPNGFVLSGGDILDWEADQYDRATLTLATVSGPVTQGETHNLIPRPGFTLLYPNTDVSDALRAIKDQLGNLSYSVVRHCLRLLMQAPESVFKVCALLVSLMRRDDEISFRDACIREVIGHVYATSRVLLREKDTSKNLEDMDIDGRSEANSAVPHPTDDETARYFATVTHLATLLLESPTCVNHRETVLPMQVIGSNKKWGSGSLESPYDNMIGLIDLAFNGMASEKDGAPGKRPEWLTTLFLLCESVCKVSTDARQKRRMHMSTDTKWQWHDEDTHDWTLYSPANNAAINEAYWNGKPSARIQCNNRQYTVHFGTMGQVKDGSYKWREVCMRSIGFAGPQEKRQGAAASLSQNSLDSTTGKKGRCLTHHEIRRTTDVVGMTAAQRQELVCLCARFLVLGTPEMDAGTLLAILRISVRLTRDYDLARLFVRKGGVCALVCPPLCVAVRTSGTVLHFCTLIICHCVESRQVLVSAMKNAIRIHFSPDRPGSKHTDLRLLLQRMRSAVGRDPDAFLIAMRDTLRLKEGTQLLRSNCTVLQMPVELLPGSTDKSSSANQVVQYYVITERDKDAVRVVRHVLDILITGYRWEGRHRQPGHDSPLFIMCKEHILKMLAYLVECYDGMAALITRHVYSQQDYIELEHDTSAIAYIVEHVLPSFCTDSVAETPAKNCGDIVVRWLFCALISCGNEFVQIRVVDEIRSAFSRALNMPECRLKHNRLQSIAQCLCAIIGRCQSNAPRSTSPRDDTLPASDTREPVHQQAAESGQELDDRQQQQHVGGRQQQQQQQSVCQQLLSVSRDHWATTVMRHLMHTNIIVDLAKASHHLDLMSPYFASTMNAILKPLEILSRQTLQESKLDGTADGQHVANDANVNAHDEDDASRGHNSASLSLATTSRVTIPGATVASGIDDANIAMLPQEPGADGASTSNTRTDNVQNSGAQDEQMAIDSISEQAAARQATVFDSPVSTAQSLGILIGSLDVQTTARPAASSTVVANGRGVVGSVGAIPPDVSRLVDGLPHDPPPPVLVVAPRAPNELPFLHWWLIESNYGEQDGLQDTIVRVCDAFIQPLIDGVSTRDGDQQADVATPETTVTVCGNINASTLAQKTRSSRPLPPRRPEVSFDRNPYGSPTSSAGMRSAATDNQQQAGGSISVLQTSVPETSRAALSSDDTTAGTGGAQSSTTRLIEMRTQAPQAQRAREGSSHTQTSCTRHSSDISRRVDPMPTEVSSRRRPAHNAPSAHALYPSTSVTNAPTPHDRSTRRSGPASSGTQLTTAHSSASHSAAQAAESNRGPAPPTQAVAEHAQRTVPMVSGSNRVATTSARTSRGGELSIYQSPNRRTRTEVSRGDTSTAQQSPAGATETTSSGSMRTPQTQTPRLATTRPGTPRPEEPPAQVLTPAVAQSDPDGSLISTRPAQPVNPPVAAAHAPMDVDDDEVLTEQRRQVEQRRRARETADETPGAVSPEFLAALPSNLHEEVLAQHRMDQQRAAASRANPDEPVDAASFFESLQPSLRASILADMADSQMAALPPALAEEAQALRRNLEARRRHAAASAVAQAPVHQSLSQGRRLYADSQQVPQADPAQPGPSRAVHTSSSGSAMTGRGQAPSGGRGRQVDANFSHIFRRALAVIDATVQATTGVRTLAGSHSAALSSNRRSFAAASAILPPQRTAHAGELDSPTNSPDFLAGVRTRVSSEPILDEEAMACLIVLLFVQDPKFNMACVAKILCNICGNQHARNWIVHALLSILQQCARAHAQEPVRRVEDAPGLADVAPWLDIRLEASLGSRESVLLYATDRRTSNRLEINAQASEVVFQAVIDVLALIARQYSIFLLPLGDASVEHPTTSNTPLYESRSCADGVNTNLWDILITLSNRLQPHQMQTAIPADANKECKKLAVSASNEPRIPLYDQGDSPFHHMARLLPTTLCTANRVCTDRLLRLLMAVSLGMPEAIISSGVTTIVSAVDPTLLPNYVTLPASEDIIKPIVDCLALRRCSVGSVDDVLMILSNLAMGNAETGHRIYDHLMNAVVYLGQRVCKEIEAVLTELKWYKKRKEQQRSDPAEAAESLDAPRETETTIDDPVPSSSRDTVRWSGSVSRVLRDRSPLSRSPGLSEMDLKAMSTLVARSNNQQFLLLALRLSMDIRSIIKRFHPNHLRSDTSSDQQPQNPTGPVTRAGRKRLRAARNKTKTGDNSLVPVPRRYDINTPLSKNCTELSSLWQVLSKCLEELPPADEQAVTKLQHTVEAFFIIFAPNVKSQPDREAYLARVAGGPISPTATGSAITSGDPSTAGEQYFYYDMSSHTLVKTGSATLAADSAAESLVSTKQYRRITPCVAAPPGPDTPEFACFNDFALRHRAIINSIIRETHMRNLRDGSFAALIRHSHVLDFDVKRAWFRAELERLDSGLRKEKTVVHVRRQHVFEDSYRELFRRTPAEWKNRFYIVFSGEEGQDAGGVLREWYSIISRDIFNPDYAMFHTAGNDRVTYMINWMSHFNDNHLYYFKFVGHVIAKAIYDNKLLDCYFTRSFYKHILGQPVCYTDMASEDTTFYQSLRYMIENDLRKVDVELTMTADVDKLGKVEVVELVADGKNIAVTEANKAEYVRRACQMKMGGLIYKQLESFLKGFYEIIPRDLINIFNEQELELLISGYPTFDIDELKANTEYNKYQPNSPQIEWFWRALKSFSRLERCKFLQFVTGTSKVPLQGFGHLEGMNGAQRFQIHRDDRSTNRLPSAHTCFNQLDLPVYETYEKLRANLLKAITECSEGFGFA